MESLNVLSNNSGTLPIPVIVPTTNNNDLDVTAADIQEFQALLDTPRIPDPLAVTKDRQYYIQAVNLRWNKTLDGILEIGALLNEAKRRLDKEDFSLLTKVDLSFDYSVIRKFMRLASSSRITDPANRGILPPSWNTLYEIALMSDKAFRKAMELKIITPKCHCKTVRAHRAKYDPSNRKQVPQPIAIKGNVCIQLTREQYNGLYERRDAVTKAVAELLKRKFNFTHPTVELKTVDLAVTA
jgi:hypothetical protein